MDPILLQTGLLQFLFLLLFQVKGFSTEAGTYEKSGRHPEGLLDGSDGSGKYYSERL